ncbi:MAG: hypothetical protein HC884_02335 [Chloroflexaceae bacterium]|nr:hypothetical protein [Chloroflexaceae bacterium]
MSADHSHPPEPGSRPRTLTWGWVPAISVPLLLLLLLLLLTLAGCGAREPKIFSQINSGLSNGSHEYEEDGEEEIEEIEEAEEEAEGETTAEEGASTSRRPAPTAALAPPPPPSAGVDPAPAPSERDEGIEGEAPGASRGRKEATDEEEPAEEELEMPDLETAGGEGDETVGAPGLARPPGTPGPPQGGRTRRQRAV